MRHPSAWWVRTRSGAHPSWWAALNQDHLVKLWPKHTYKDNEDVFTQKIVQCMAYIHHQQLSTTNKTTNTSTDIGEIKWHQHKAQSYCSTQPSPRVKAVLLGHWKGIRFPDKADNQCQETLRSRGSITQLGLVDHNKHLVGNILKLKDKNGHAWRIWNGKWGACE